MLLKTKNCKKMCFNKTQALPSFFSASLADIREGRRINPSLNLRSLKKAQPL